MNQYNWNNVEISLTVPQRIVGSNNSLDNKYFVTVYSFKQWLYVCDECYICIYVHRVNNKDNSVFLPNHGETKTRVIAAFDIVAYVYLSLL